MDSFDRNLPVPPDVISGKIVSLHFVDIKPGDTRYGFVPFYNFDILLPDERTKIGHINFKVGSTIHVLFCAGHIGYGIDIPFRGHSYAYHACITLSPFIRTIYDSVILTVDSGNNPSIKTIEKLGAIYLGIGQIPTCDPNYEKGIRVRRRYMWNISR